MTRGRYPPLRRLLALGLAPGRAAARLERPLTRLTALARDHSELPVLSDRVLEPLARSLDLAGLAERVAPEPAAAPVGRPSDARARVTGSATATARERRPFGEPPSPPSRMPRREPSSPGARPPRRDVPGSPGDIAAASARVERALAAGGASSGSPRRARRAASDDPGRSPRGRARVSVAEATASLRDRALKAGGATVADTPIVWREASAHVVTILETTPARIATERGGERAARVPEPPRAIVEAHSASIGGLARLARAVERVTASRPPLHDDARSSSSRPSPVVTAGGGDNDSAPALAPAATAEGRRGLRGLAERAAAEAPAPTFEPHGAGGESAVAALVAERAGEAELARRISQVLRREARRQGIDVGLVGP